MTHCLSSDLLIWSESVVKAEVNRHATFGDQGVFGLYDHVDLCDLSRQVAASVEAVYFGVHAPIRRRIIIIICPDDY